MRGHGGRLGRVGALADPTGASVGVGGLGLVVGVGLGLRARVRDTSCRARVRARVGLWVPYGLGVKGSLGLELGPGLVEKACGLRSRSSTNANPNPSSNAS